MAIFQLSVSMSFLTNVVIKWFLSTYIYSEDR